MKKDSVFTQSIGMCFGLIYGVTVGIATHNIGLWLPIGLCLGVCIGAAMEKRNLKKQQTRYVTDLKEILAKLAAEE